MKKIIISLIAIATLAACNKSEMVETYPGESITFGNVFVDNATRAKDPSYSATDITKFNVYGTVNDVIIFPGTEVTKGTSNYGTTWTCPVNQYWIPGASYKFVGIVDGAIEGVTKTNLTNGMPVSIEYIADGKTDLLCETITKTAKTDGTANGLVAFNFTHLLSKVNFTVNNNSYEAYGYSFIVKNIKFAGKTKATYDLSTGWKDATEGNILLANIEVATLNKSNEMETEMLLIPGNVKVTFTVDILYNGKIITTTDYAPEATFTLAAGNAYNFNVTVSVGEKIEFTVTKKPEWTTNDQIDLE